MDLTEITEKINALPETMNGIVDEKLKTQKAEVLADLNVVVEKQQKQEEWLREVEARLAKSRTSLDNTDHLKTAIPERYHKCIDLAVRGGVRDPVKFVAMESWLKCATRAQIPRLNSGNPGQFYEEMLKLETALGVDPEAKAALQEDTSDEGGYLVPTPLEAEVLRVIEDSAVLRPLVRKLTMTAKTHNIPDEATGVTAAIVAEEAQISESEPTFGLKALTAKKIGVRGIGSQELIQDAAVGILAYWQQISNEKIALLEDAQGLEGDGTGVNFTGVAAASGVNSVSLGTDGAGISMGKLLETKWKAKKRSTRRGAAWICAPEIAQDLENMVVDVSATDFRPLWSFITPGLPTAFSATTSPNGPDGTLLGFPYYTSDEISVTVTQGANSDTSRVYFGPWGHGFIIGDLLGLQFAVSEHILFDKFQLMFRLLKRTAMLVAIPADFTKMLGARVGTQGQP